MMVELQILLRKIIKFNNEIFFDYFQELLNLRDDFRFVLGESGGECLEW